MNEEKKDIKQLNVFEKLKSNKVLRYAVIVLLAILLIVILLSNNFTENTSSVSDGELEYIERLEKRLSDTLSSVNGAGKVSIVITVESGMESVLASKVTTNENSNGIETEETPIIVNGKTVIIKENYPKVSGVLIVAEGASSLSVRNKLQQATISLLDIDINRIEILTMK